MHVRSKAISTAMRGAAPESVNGYGSASTHLCSDATDETLTAIWGTGACARLRRFSIRAGPHEIFSISPGGRASAGRGAGKWHR